MGSNDVAKPAQNCDSFQFHSTKEQYRVAKCPTGLLKNSQDSELEDFHTANEMLRQIEILQKAYKKPL